MLGPNKIPLSPKHGRAVPRYVDEIDGGFLVLGSPPLAHPPSPRSLGRSVQKTPPVTKELSMFQSHLCLLPLLRLLQTLANVRAYLRTQHFDTTIVSDVNIHTNVFFTDILQPMNCIQRPKTVVGLGGIPSSKMALTTFFLDGQQHHSDPILGPNIARRPDTLDHQLQAPITSMGMQIAGLHPQCMSGLFSF